ncbi:hypothetical protein RRSWK_04822 [Rhodopirellula sp. SWK7]|nr:hypothetical protein RRSWK_04822 [Rhodopirellula sp. SWK7]
MATFANHLLRATTARSKDRPLLGFVFTGHESSARKTGRVIENVADE